MPKLRQHDRDRNRAYSHSTEEAYQLSEEGKLILDGCVILGNTPDWECVQCKTYMQTKKKQKLEHLVIDLSLLFLQKSLMVLIDFFPS